MNRRLYLKEKQRRPRGCVARRMQPEFHHGLLLSTKPGVSPCIFRATHDDLWPAVEPAAGGLMLNDPSTTRRQAVEQIASVWREHALAARRLAQHTGLTTVVSL